MKILVRAPNWLGDIVMALPAIETIRRHFPDASLTVAAPAAFAPLCAAAPGVDAVLPLAKGAGRAARAARVAAMRAGGFDIAILLTNSFASALDPWRAGIPERWGFRADWRGRLLTRAIERPRKPKRAAARRSRQSPEAAAAPRGTQPFADRTAAAGVPTTVVLTTAVGRPADIGSPAHAATTTDVVRTTAVGSEHMAGGAAEAGGDLPPRERHHSEYYLALTTALGMRPLRAFRPLTVTPEAEAKARTLLRGAGWDGARPLVAVAPGAAYGFAKRWPPERMAAVVDRLAAIGFDAVLVGAPADRESARAVESALASYASASRAPADRAHRADPADQADERDRPGEAAGTSAAAKIARQAGSGTITAVAAGARGRCLNVVGQTDLPTLMGLFGACAAVLSNDSGAMHLASAVSRPVVAVFGPTDDVATAPLGRHAIVRHEVWCRPCLLRECPIDHRCMRGIAPDAVFDALMTTIAAAA